MQIAGVDEDDLWTSGEIALVLGVVPSAIPNWQKRGHMPMPYVIVKGTPLWKTEQVHAIMENRGLSTEKVRALLDRLDGWKNG